MQFPNPIVRSLILYDNSGNAVVILGPGPLIKIINPTSGAELDLDAGTTFPEAVFWNTAHTDFGKISLEVSPFSSNQMLLLRSPAEPSPVLPGNPLIQMRMFMTSFLQLGDVKPPNTNSGVGGQLVLDEASWSLSRRDNATQADVTYIRCIQNDDVEIAPGLGRDLIIAADDPFSHSGIVFDGTDNTLKAWTSGLPEDWVALTYQNGWSNLGGGNGAGAVKYMADGRVWLKGVIIGGTKADGTILFNLPALYRPSAIRVLSIALISAGAAGPNVQLRVATNGDVTCFGIAATTTGNLSMDCSSYTKNG